MKAILVAAVLLAGCTGEYEATVSAGAVTASRTSDNFLKTSEWTLCKAQSVGAIMRRYGNNPNLWDAYKTLCWPNSVADDLTHN